MLSLYEQNKTQVRVAGIYREHHCEMPQLFLSILYEGTIDGG